MGHPTTKKTLENNSGVTERELRESGIPEPGDLGDAKKEAFALVIGLVVLALIVVAMVIELRG